MLGKNFILGIPPGISIIRKEGNRRAFVGIVDPVRKQLANGFELNGPPPVGYRIVEYGPFSVFVGSSAAVDVKVILDGKVLEETRLLPFMSVAGRFMNQGEDKTLQVGRCNATGHVLSFMENNQSKPFMFAPHDPNLTADQIAEEQIHAGRFSPVSFNRSVVEAPELQEVQTDSVEESQEDQPQELMVDESPFEVDQSEVAELAQALVPALQGLLQQPMAIASPAAEVAEDAKDADVVDVTDEAGNGEDIMFTLTPEQAKASITNDIPEWAPSHGLVAVGIRFVQVTELNEPTPPPDEYKYVLFQLNPFRLNAKVYAKRMKDIELPPKRMVKEIISSWSDVISERGELGDRGNCGQSKFRNHSLASKFEKGGDEHSH